MKSGLSFYELACTNAGHIPLMEGVLYLAVTQLPKL
jgi:hypothetical protein